MQSKEKGEERESEPRLFRNNRKEETQYRFVPKNKSMRQNRSVPLIFCCNTDRTISCPVSAGVSSSCGATTALRSAERPACGTGKVGISAARVHWTISSMWKECVSRKRSCFCRTRFRQLFVLSRRPSKCRNRKCLHCPKQLQTTGECLHICCIGESTARSSATASEPVFCTKAPDTITPCL